jgi:hypothetical protein
LKFCVPKNLWSRYLSLHFFRVTFINEASGPSKQTTGGQTVI